MEGTLRDQVQKRAVNPTAATPRPTMAWNIRTSADTAVIAAFALLAVIADPTGAPPVVVPVLELLVLLVGEEDNDPMTDDDAMRDDDPMADDDAVVGVNETVFVTLGTLPVTDAEVAPPIGGGLASAAFTSAPVPQGIASPSG